MEPPLFETLNNIAYMMGGFFDFVVFVGVLVVAIRWVRPLDQGLGTGIVFLAVARFLFIVGSRVVAAVFNPIPFHDMNGLIPIVVTFFDFAIQFLDLALWGVVLLALSRLASRAVR